MKRYLVLLLAALVMSCGGGDESGGTTGGGTPGGGDTPGGGTPGGGDGGGNTSGSIVQCGGNAGAPAPAGARIEECNAAVTLSSGWTTTDSRYGWSGGTAAKSSVAGATASFTFTGTSVRWVGARGRGMGRARLRIDGGRAADRQVDLYGFPDDVIRTPIVTISGLSNGTHTLSVEVMFGVVVLDAFEVQPQTTVSHWQDTDPNAKFSAGWTKASTAFPWSGNGAANVPELPVTAQETYTTGETLTLPFRGTAISWIGYRGPDGGIATVQVDGGAPVEVDTYAATAKYQEVVHTVTGLADADHTLTITATGRRNTASSAPRIVVDAFDVMRPGRRYEEYEPSITKSTAAPEIEIEKPHWVRNPNRVWSEGSVAASNQTGATLTFSFTGSSVTWIGSRKSSAGGTANVYIDGVLVQEVRLFERYPIEGYQMPVFRAEGLSPGPHTLTIEVTSRNDGPYVVVDAFDVQP
jgi:hypothetical protein